MSLGNIPWFWVIATILAMHYFLGGFVSKVLP